jgi:L-alanine-DL-glutamate epimerase-like enolase superfamily enzyme
MKSDIRPIASELFFLPVATRVPLKFGHETLTTVICARVRLTVQGSDGRRADGWGETPLSVQWTWPSALPYQARLDALKDLCMRLAREWAEFDVTGHPIEIGSAFARDMLPHKSEIPRLAALVCNSPFDIALHDAYGNLHGVPTYATYNARSMNRDLSGYFDDPAFRGKYPADFLVENPPKSLAAWHLVGGLDPLTPQDLAGDEPDDGYPVLLPDWIARDGLTCLKIKLRGNDAPWDLNRLVSVGDIAIRHGVRHLSADFNCTVSDPQYVCDILDQLRADHAEIFQRLLYVEQPFPYDLEKNRIDVRAVTSRKPLFLDESAHDWHMIQLGQSLGWNGVALKTCKTQTGAILSACWARANGMQIMVQDLTNPMLAMIPHALLAAHVGTIMGIETNACQFYPQASSCEAKVHPGLFTRRDGKIDLSSIAGSGFGYCLAEIDRALPPAAQSA